MGDQTYTDLGFLDIACAKCGTGFCHLWGAPTPGDWLCDDCTEIDGGIAPPQPDRVTTAV